MVEVGNRTISWFEAGAA